MNIQSPLLLAAALLLPASPRAEELRADHAAARWDHAYPVGNGSLGGMSYGAFPNERIALNHDTIWSQPKRARPGRGLPHQRHGAGLRPRAQGRLRRPGRLLPRQE